MERVARAERRMVEVYILAVLRYGIDGL